MDVGSSKKIHISLSENEAFMLEQILLEAKPEIAERWGESDNKFQEFNHELLMKISKENVKKI